MVPLRRPSAGADDSAAGLSTAEDAAPPGFGMRPVQNIQISARVSALE